MAARKSPEPLEFTHQPLVPTGLPPEPPRPPRKPLLGIPLWLKWSLSLLVGVILTVALVIYVNHHNSDNPNGVGLTKTGIEQENQESVALEKQDQAPQTARVPAHLAPMHAVVEAVHSAMEFRITQSEAGPPLKTASCDTTVTIAAKHGYSCTVLAGGVRYDFVAVVDSTSRVLTLCKRDPPPAPELNVPLDPSCTP